MMILLEIRSCDRNDDFYTTLLKSRLSVREELRENRNLFKQNRGF
ncbi:MAG: hypothetical protein V8R39_00045 [Clostridia bacterium]